jgi:23S rRNA (cytosine1962-C5)-methyltransferase
MTSNPIAAVSEASITAAGVRRLRAGHLWIYAGDVTQEPANQEAPLVRVLDPAGKALGYAFYSKTSQIRLRILSRRPEPPDRAFFLDGIRRSVARRGTRAGGATSACRLVFGEADLLPSVLVDRYGDYLALQTLSRGSDALKPLLAGILAELLAPKGIFERNDVKARKLEGLEEQKGLLAGSMPEIIEIEEAGIRFAVDLAHGQKTGFFLDQSENRVAAREFAAGKVLDCFTNTGGFALHFAPRCTSVLALDISADSLAQARRNADLNEIRNVDFQEGNVFDLLRQLEHAGEKFDMVCLDPPAFAKNRGALSAAQGGYKEINLRAMKLLKPEGILATASCSYHLSEADFHEVIAHAAQDARRYVQIIERRGQAADHPILASMPETHYLKFFILRVL